MTSLLGNNSRRPDISFHTNGTIDITARVAKMLNLADGDVIDVALDDGEYYLYVRWRGKFISGNYEAQVHPTKRGSHNFRAHSAKLCRNVLRYSGVDNNDVVRLPVGDYQVWNEHPSAILIIQNNIL